MPSPDALQERTYRPEIPATARANALEQLYVAFDAVPFDAAMPRYSPTVTDADLTALSGPVRTLPPSVVARFILKAGTTWGGPDDIRRITPRALELAADQQLPLDRGLLWAKLRWAGWPDWPTYQATTTREFLRAEWACLLRSAPRPAHVAHRWLRQTADGIDDLTPFFDEWHDALSPITPPLHRRAATGHLVLLLSNSPLRPDFPATVAELFPGNEPAAKQLTTWLTGPGTAHVLEQAARALADTTDARRVTVAHERLRRFQAAVARATPNLGQPNPT